MIYYSPARSFVFCILLILLCVTGCRPGFVGQLQGEWIGTPQPPADENLEDASGDLEVTEESGDELNRSAKPITDWQQYNAVVQMHFLSDSHVELSMEGKPDKVTANWRVVEESPASLLLEFATPPAKTDDSTDDDKPEAPSEVLRRFELLPQFNGDKMNGFVFSEAGADRGVGELYFVRKDGEK